MKSIRRACTLSFALVAWCAACSDDPPAPEVAYVQIDPEEVEIEVGQSMTLAATAFDETGKKMEAGAAAWSSSDPAVAAVSEGGEVVGVAPGDAVVSASIGGKSGRTAVKVLPPGVARVDIAPAAARIRPDETVQLSATAFSAWEAKVEGREVTWSSADPDVASVSEGGLVRGREPGMATILAIVDDVAGSVVVEVIPHVSVVRVEPIDLVLFEGESGTLEAVVLGTNGATLEDREVAWSSTAPEVATVDEAGVVQALRPGKATIYAEVEEVVNLATVEVRPLPATLRIEPPSLLLQVDTTWGLSALVTDTLGVERTAEGCTWRSLDPEVLRVGGGGAVHAVARGLTHVEATCEGLQASIQAEILPRAELEIDGPDRVVVGESIQLQVLAGDREPRGEARMVAGSEEVAELDSDGLLHGLAPGRAWVFAEAEGRTVGRELLSVLRFDELRSGPWHTCGRATTGEFHCWGNTRLHLPGEVAAWPTPIPHPIRPFAGDPFTDLALGEVLSYGLRDERRFPWGCDDWTCEFAEMGSVVGGPTASPPRVSAGYALRTVQPGGVFRFSHFACGLQVDGRVECWGEAIPPSSNPFAIQFDEAAFEGDFANTAQTFVEVGVGLTSVCALTEDGEVWCWGSGGIDAADGLSFEEGTGSPLPAPLPGAPALASLSVGKYHACGVTPAGSAWCWGHSREGALGAGSLGSSEAPVEVAGGHVFRHVSASIEHTCGLTVDDEILCWGRGEAEPVQVPLAGPFLQVVAGARHACALRTDGVALCWGDASLSQTADDAASIHDGSPRPIYPENR
ncbi:MAG TPA: Ig-like domain-containing protein [Vulgatibacter sp.]|nr:Ig-like domain-containing protein [Vulgatibacter sp.]